MQNNPKDGYQFSFAGITLVALGSGALWWPQQKLLCVSDLHLGKSERLARLGGTTLPPYETRDTLDRLSKDIDRFQPKTVVCLGDSFDDPEVTSSLPDSDRMDIARLQAGRRWLWIEGNHDPGPLDLGGTHLAELSCGPLTFRHIANQNLRAEVSGHYHPKAQIRLRGRVVSRPAFLLNQDRLILPAFGTYTGGLRHDAAPLAHLMKTPAIALVTGPVVHAIPLS